MECLGEPDRRVVGLARAVSVTRFPAVTADALPCEGRLRPGRRNEREAFLGELGGSPEVADALGGDRGPS
jgi:hypothetical protein